MFGEDLKNQLLSTAVPSIFAFKKRRNVDVHMGEESEEGAPKKNQILSDIVIHPAAFSSTPTTSKIPVSSPLALTCIVNSNLLTQDPAPLKSPVETQTTNWLSSSTLREHKAYFY
ncbi:hypothetical protein JTB14_008478 [Gonioctena quinquepunctata]|nr:hypothetical protein JTB14_008478 [Gonioctena quinquepunctata]